MITSTDARTMIEARLASMASGDLDDARRACHPEAVNREALNEPPDCRTPGPEGFYATALWLRGMFSDLRWDVHEAVAQNDLVVVHATMHGRHTGPLTRYSPAGELVLDIPATGRSFSVTQTHWFRYRDDLIAEHWANRDDLGQLVQLGLMN